MTGFVRTIRVIDDRVVREATGQRAHGVGRLVDIAEHAGERAGRGGGRVVDGLGNDDPVRVHTRAVRGEPPRGRVRVFSWTDVHTAR